MKNGANPACPNEPTGNAEPQLGAFHRGWYRRRSLPHFDQPGLLQAITYRLADSLPNEVLAWISEALQAVPPGRRSVERRQQLEAQLDIGHGSCVLRDPAIAACVVETWQRFDGVRYDLLAWVVMPTHVHVLIQTYEGFPLGKIVQSWKSYTAKRILQWQPQVRDPTCRPRQVWMREYWDRAIRDEKHFLAVLDYIHQNPAKAGLVARAEDWPWSSAREMAGSQVD